MRPDNGVIRILLVDDDEDDYIILRDLVKEINGGDYQLEWIAEADRALPFILEERHEVYLIDYLLGKEDGIELVRAAHAGGCKRPMILLTGQADRALDLRAMEAGCCDFLVKGKIDALILERTVRYCIREKSLEATILMSHDELERRVEERTKELERAVASLREADQRKDEFLAILAHELRNPLAPIRLALHVLENEAAPARALERAREILAEQIEQMVRIVDDVMDVSRITLGKVELKLEQVAVGSLIESAAEGARPAFEARNHRLELDIPCSEEQISVDPARLRQVLQNLLTNAAKYTEPGGVIRVEVRDVGNAIALTVADNGMGLTPEVRERIFEPFSQDHRTLAHSDGGIGIGLTISRRLIEQHGGRIDVESNGPGHGSRFTVILPRERL